MIYLIMKSKLQTTKKTINKGSPTEKLLGDNLCIVVMILLVILD